MNFGHKKHTTERVELDLHKRLRECLYGSAFALLVLAGCSSTTEPVRKSVKLNFTYKSQIGADSLLPPYPNPFARTMGDTAVNVMFMMHDSGSAVVLIQNVTGEEIAGYSDSTLRAGTYTGSWNPMASDGTPLRSGLYFITLRLNNYIQSRLVNVQINE